MPFKPIFPQSADENDCRKISYFNGRTVCFWHSGREDPNRDGVTDMASCPDATNNEWEKVLRACRSFVDSGRFPNNKQKFKKLEDEDALYEIKGGLQLRLLGTFLADNVFGVCLCVRKKTQKHSLSNLKSARVKITSMREDWAYSETKDSSKVATTCHILQ